MKGGSLLAARLSYASGPVIGDTDTRTFMEDLTFELQTRPRGYQYECAFVYAYQGDELVGQMQMTPIEGGDLWGAFPEGDTDEIDQAMFEYGRTHFNDKLIIDTSGYVPGEIIPGFDPPPNGVPTGWHTQPGAGEAEALVRSAGSFGIDDRGLPEWRDGQEETERTYLTNGMMIDPDGETWTFKNPQLVGENISWPTGTPVYELYRNGQRDGMMTVKEVNWLVQQGKLKPVPNVPKQQNADQPGLEWGKLVGQIPEVQKFPQGMQQQLEAMPVKRQGNARKPVMDEWPADAIQPFETVKVTKPWETFMGTVLQYLPRTTGGPAYLIERKDTPLEEDGSHEHVAVLVDQVQRVEAAPDSPFGLTHDTPEQIHDMMRNAAHIDERGMSVFAPGDRFRYENPGEIFHGSQGEILSVHPYDGYDVKFDNAIDGHTLRTHSTFLKPVDPPNDMEMELRNQQVERDHVNQAYMWAVGPYMDNVMLPKLGETGHLEEHGLDPNPALGHLQLGDRLGMLRAWAGHKDRIWQYPELTHQLDQMRAEWDHPENGDEQHLDLARNAYDKMLASYDDHRDSPIKLMEANNWGREKGRMEGHGFKWDSWKSRWVDPGGDDPLKLPEHWSSLEGGFQIGDIVQTMLGPARIKATGESPLGRVYRVNGVFGDSEYDVHEQDVRVEPTPVAHLAHMDFHQAHDYIVKNQGGTFDPHTMEPIETDEGYGTGLRFDEHPQSEEGHPAATFSPADLAGYHAQYGKTAKQHDVRIGSWLYNDQYWFDLSDWFPTRDQAILACIDNLQVAAFDCKVAASLPPDEKWRAAFNVLTDDRDEILPNVLDELEAYGFDAEQAQQRLAAAWERWGDHVRAQEDK